MDKIIKFDMSDQSRDKKKKSKLMIRNDKTRNKRDSLPKKRQIVQVDQNELTYTY